MMPPCDQTGVPGLVALTHFHSSTPSGSAFLMSLRILLRVSPRQSPSSAILFEMSSDADWPWLAPDLFMLSSYPLAGVACTRRQEIREPPEHAGGRRPAPRLRAVPHREVGDERRAEGDGEAGVGPLLEPRRHRRKQQHHAKELGPRE